MGASVSSDPAVVAGNQNSSSEIQQLKDSVSTNLSLTISGGVVVSVFLLVFLIVLIGMHFMGKLWRESHHDRLTDLERCLPAPSSSVGLTTTNSVGTETSRC